MAIPKSDKLKKELQSDNNKKSIQLPLSFQDLLDKEDNSCVGQGGTLKIKKLDCYNDFVAILLNKVKSSIELPTSQQFKNEGVIVGVGSGVPGQAGLSNEPQVKIGDAVIFAARTSALELEPENGFYKGQKIVIVSERSLICKQSSPIQFEVVE